MAKPEDTPTAGLLEEAIIVLFCQIDDAYRNLNPQGSRYESPNRLSDSEIITLTLFQQLRGVESERSFLRDAERFFSHRFPGVVGLAPSSLHRRIRKLRRFLEPLRRSRSAALGRRREDTPLVEGVKKAEEALQSGAALKLLDRLRQPVPVMS